MGYTQSHHRIGHWAECRVRQELNQKRYLLILDDVWNENQEDWVRLECILACGSIGASVIVTTRLKKVADIVRTLPALCLTMLTEEQCWLLFKLRAFGKENDQHPNLEIIGRRIVKKCGGVPLAVKALGGLLRDKREENEWIRVEESHVWNLPEEENSILSVLRLSYRHLPFVLKRCFAYCAVFPKDYVFVKEKLIFHWMAHGCISSDGNEDVEDVGIEIKHSRASASNDKIRHVEWRKPSKSFENSKDNWRKDGKVAYYNRQVETFAALGLDRDRYNKSTKLKKMMDDEKVLRFRYFYSLLIRTKIYYAMNPGNSRSKYLNLVVNIQELQTLLKKIKSSIKIRHFVTAFKRSCSRFFHSHPGDDII
ncbi:hypothetical protein ACS0TY_016549 [Phlomoides rotata]